LNILVTTMGVSWQIIPELLGFTNPHFVDLFANHPSCLDQACVVLAKKAIEHNVKYIEVRCSPVKYAGQGMTEQEVCKIITKSFSEYHDRLKISLIFTASRHGEIDQIKQHVALAGIIAGQENEKALISLKDFDLAGDEKICSASKMQSYFLPIMKKCMPFSIHAGEDNPSDSIWEAVYYLNVELIGHGLTLKDNPALMEKILDRNIALEMCPSSNFQIVGFKDNYYSSTMTFEVYALKEYLDKGLAVTVNTDNPGISDTNFTKELHRACRLTHEGLSLWEILSIIRNSFKAFFAPRSIKT
jgi:adenosine deaminase